MNDMSMDMLQEPPMPQDPSMMGGDPNMVGQDPNAMPPEAMGAQESPMGGDEPMQGNDSGVDKGAEKNAGELSNILGDANEETANYVGNMVASALGKNAQLNSSDRKKMADKILGDSTDEGDEQNPQDDGQEPPMQESRSYRLNKLIDEALNSILYDSYKERPNSKLDKGYMKDFENPFTSPKNL